MAETPEAPETDLTLIGCQTKSFLFIASLIVLGVLFLLSLITICVFIVRLRRANYIAQEYRAFKRAHPEMFSDDSADTKDRWSTPPKAAEDTPVSPMSPMSDPTPARRMPFTYEYSDGRKITIMPADPRPPSVYAPYEGPPQREVSSYSLTECGSYLHPRFTNDSSIELEPLTEPSGSHNTGTASSQVRRSRFREHSPGVVGDLERQQPPVVWEGGSRNLTH